MTVRDKKIAIIYLLWGEEPQRYLARALQAMAAQTYNHANSHLVIVYNPAVDLPSAADFIRTTLLTWENKIPSATLLEQTVNLGFSGGNNAGMKWATDNHFDYVFLHNADGYLHSQALERMVQVMEGDKQIGAAQCLMLLHPETGLINSAGNNYHYLGIGYCDYFRQSIDSHPMPVQKEIGYASGAAVMLRGDLLAKYGFWNEDFFMYHEDTEYSLRLRMLGYKIRLVGEAIFYHEYEFLKSVKKYYWLERNRHALKLMFYRWPTLILMWPLELVYNLGLMVVAFKGGWLREYWSAVKYWWAVKNWQVWLKHRRLIQSQRVISDRALLKSAVFKVNNDGLVTAKIISFLANGVFAIYYFLLRLLVWW